MSRILPAGLAALTAVGLSVSGTEAAIAATRATTLHAATVRVAGKRQSIVVNSRGRSVYELTGDSASHSLCSSRACLAQWPAVTASRASERGVSGKLSIWRHHGLSQVTLNGHPLYTFAGDSGAGQANGQGIRNFGGTWFVLSKSGRAIR